MPILNITALPQKNNSLVKLALKKTSESIAKFYNCDPKQVWITWNEVKNGLYFEGDINHSSQPLNTHPPIATLTCFEGLSEKQIEDLLILTAKTLSETLEIPNNIFINYQEAKSGRVISGDGVVRKK